MIYTITFNPAIGYIVRVPTIKLGEKNRALGFIGGFTGEYIKNFLENEGIETDGEPQQEAQQLLN